jgi:hypothetical protein
MVLAVLTAKVYSKSIVQAPQSLDTWSVELATNPIRVEPRLLDACKDRRKPSRNHGIQDIMRILVPQGHDNMDAQSFTHAFYPAPMILNPNVSSYDPLDSLSSHQVWK